MAKDFLPRVGYFHLKDTTESDWKELGAGQVDLDALMPVVLDRTPEWVVVEQDVTGGPAVDSARMSRRYLMERWRI